MILRPLAFGYLLTFLSAFGQTFFIGIFGADLRAATGLGDGGFGTVYAVATLTSAACMLGLGGAVDRVALPTFTVASTAVLAVGCILLSQVDEVAWLALALFLLRFGGQGLLTHTAVTATARLFDRNRGRALSIVLLGHPTGEAILPPVAVLAAGAFGWRSIWVVAAIALLLAMPALVYFCSQPRLGLSRNRTERPAQSGTGRGLVGATRSHVIRDPRFYMLLPTVLLPAAIVTGVFIHQLRLVEEKDWELSWFAGTFVAFAVAQAIGLLGAGPLVDRFTARRAAPLVLLPLGAACLFINATDEKFVAILFMTCAGLTNGASASVATAMWAELYGILHLGSIRALAASLTTVSTALAPVIFGWLIEVEVRIGTMLLVCGGLIAIAAPLARRALLRTS